MDNTKQSPEPRTLDAPLVLPADQLERVVGGTAPRIGPIGPTNGLIRVLQ